MNAYEIARAEATRVVEAAYRKAVAAGELPEGTIPPVAVETPKDSSNGDWASTFAMQCAKPLHMAPRKIAESIVANLDLEGSCFDTVTIAGPGFMNFTLNQGWYEQAVRGVFAMSTFRLRTAVSARFKTASPEKTKCSPAFEPHKPPLKKKPRSGSSRSAATAWFHRLRSITCTVCTRIPEFCGLTPIRTFPCLKTAIRTRMLWCWGLCSAQANRQWRGS